MSSPCFRKIHAAIVASLLLLLMPFAHADTKSDQDAQIILHMLDYVSVDYGRAVQQGKILNQEEFKEQVEFSAQAIKLLSKLPEQPRREELIAQAQALAHSVQNTAPAAQISSAAQLLRREIIATYQVSVSPRRAPKLDQAIVLYQTLCASCHGASGHGDGPAGKSLDPKPANFHDAVRMNQRSVYGLYNTITLGVNGTAMTEHTQLSDDQRWALAFFTSNFRTSPQQLEQGRQLWEQHDVKNAPLDMVALATLTQNEIAAKYGATTQEVFVYLRSQPHALVSARNSTLKFTSEQLDQALASYRNGDQASAQSYAIAAYLEGFEPMEAGLNSLDSKLRHTIESEMMAVRQLMNGKNSVEVVAKQIDHTKTLLSQADVLLQEGKLSVAGAFIGALLVLLREGLEAILVLAAVITFVVKSGQRQALPYIHAGWGAALLLGVLTWATATWLVDLSGASREITEGVTALIASAMLIYVGFWLHDKAHAQAWQKFLKEKVGAALEQKTLWALGLVSFFAVYREIFETVLFYQALWAQGGEETRSALWGGMLTATLMLLATGWGLFRFGLRLPLGPFFSSTSILLAILAVIFAGQGVAALQKAGVIGSNAVNFVTVPILGVFPTTQTLLVQVSVIAILILCFRIPGTRQRKSAIDIPPTSPV